MLVNIIRFIRGYVDFCAYGKFPERFLNITSRYGVNLWNARPVKNGIEASMYVCDYRRIRKIAKKSKVVPKITAKHGLPFFFNKYKSRTGLLAGAAAGILITLILSNFIWSVSITGTVNVSKTRLYEVLKENGVSTGVYKNNLDVEKIERDTMLKIKEIGWMSINITGNVASVEIKEKTEKPDINSDTTPCNIKARCDGVITNIKAKSGTSKVLIGSGVTKGDLLVSGITETKMNTIQYVHANAEVFADVISKKELSLPQKYNYSSISDNKAERNRLFFLWTEFPVSLSFEKFENSIYSDKTENLFCNNVILPAGIKTQTEYELGSVKCDHNKESAQKVFENELLLYEVFEKSKSKVESRKIKTELKNDVYICKAEYVFNENIAQSVDFSVTE